MTIDKSSEIAAHVECCCEHPAPALCPSILLSHDGTAFVAQLLGGVGPKGRGSSYRAALASLETIMAIGREMATLDSGGVTGVIRRRPYNRRHVPTLKGRLIERFGHLSNRELAARIGIVARDAPSMLSCAIGGNGTRAVRCSIAFALGELPSNLWPGRSDKRQQEDDAEFRKMMSEQTRDIYRRLG